MRGPEMMIRRPPMGLKHISGSRPRRDGFFRGLQSDSGAQCLLRLSCQPDRQYLLHERAHDVYYGLLHSPSALKIRAKRPWLLPGIGNAQSLGKRLQELPPDGRVAFDQRAKFPKRQRVTNQVARSRHGSRARAAVDQRNLAEIVARAERGDLHTFARDDSFAGVDEKKGCASRALDDDRFALGEAAL